MLKGRQVRKVAPAFSRCPAKRRLKADATPVAPVTEFAGLSQPTSGVAARCFADGFVAAPHLQRVR